MDEFEHNQDMLDDFDAESDYLLEQQSVDDLFHVGFIHIMEPVEDW